MTANANKEWEKWWDARLVAIESVLGKSESVVGHSVVPFEFGVEVGGGADLLYFRHHIPGRVSVTADLIGNAEQIRNDLGNYELMICHRDDEEWGPNTISRLAYYTLEAELSPGHTMGMSSVVPKGSTIAAFLFYEYGRFKVRRKKAGLMLCMGITAEELDDCRNGHRAEVERALKESGCFPYTDLYRSKALKGRQRKWRLN